jgi:hypothetical protein
MIAVVGRRVSGVHASWTILTLSYAVQRGTWLCLAGAAWTVRGCLAIVSPLDNVVAYGNAAKSLGRALILFRQSALQAV